MGMTMQKTSIIRHQLSDTLHKFAALSAIPAPPKGWLRAVRDALGMNTRQFGERMGVTRARASKIESDEVAGSLTLNTLRKAAAALDCKLVYALVPKTTLDDTVKHQATRKAQELLETTSHTMTLEAQELSKASRKQMLAELIEEMLRDQPKSLWDE